MRNRLAWISGAAGGFALFRLLARRRRPAIEAPAPRPDPRADDLRRKLAESRAVVDEREEFEAAETTVDEAEPAGGVEERRRAVHRQARDAAERMRDGGG